MLSKSDCRNQEQKKSSNDPAKHARVCAASSEYWKDETPACLEHQWSIFEVFSRQASGSRSLVQSALASHTVPGATRVRAVRNFDVFTRTTAPMMTNMPITMYRSMTSPRNIHPRNTAITGLT